jgi:hypothetical protein
MQEWSAAESAAQRKIRPIRTDRFTIPGGVFMAAKRRAKKATKRKATKRKTTKRKATKRRKAAKKTTRPKRRR